MDGTTEIERDGWNDRDEREMDGTTEMRERWMERQR